MTTVKLKTQKPAQSSPEQQLAVSTAPSVPAATSDEALDRHLAEWGGSGGRLLAFNGSTGIHRTLDDGVEVPPGTEFVAFLHETQRGFIKFVEDGPPDVRMVRISENAEVPKRETLGDRDQRSWPVGLDGTKQDPWKEQYAIPLARHDAGGELFIYIARGAVAMNSASTLLGHWRYHPKRQGGLIPVVKIENGTYPSKRFGGLKPKPILRIVDWVTRTGAPPPPPVPARVALNDEIPF
jgi:hypothetical protein